MRTKGGKSNRFRATTGVRQGCCLSPVLFNIHMDKIIREVLSSVDRGGIEIEYKTEDDLYLNYRCRAKGHTEIGEGMYSDDLAVIARSFCCLQQSLDTFHKACVKWSMSISGKKTKVLSVCNKQAHISIDGHHLQNVDEFCYVGIVIPKSGGCCEEIEKRIVKASTAFNCWRKRVFSNINFSRAIKLKVFQTIVLSVLLYGCETWLVTQANIHKLNTFHMRCIRMVLECLNDIK